MKAFCISVFGKQYSMDAANRCVQSARKHGVDAEIIGGVAPDFAVGTMESYKLRWTWAKGNTEADICPITGLKQHPYPTKDFRMRIGCAMSHYNLWMKCLELGEPILILEHDTVFLRPLPKIEQAYGAIMLNNPKGATPRGGWWMGKIADKGAGIHGKTKVFQDHDMRPDGLAGGSAYVITPLAAFTAIMAYKTLGVWPNDATLCRQLVGGLQECYPFVTEVRPEKSMQEGY